MSSTILVVDDAAFMRMMIRDILSKEGYIIQEAVNGRDAVDKYAEMHPDLVTLDITMPEMNGLDALRAIKASDKDVEALEAGAMDFLVKPFQPTKVLETVKKCLQSAPR
jgi:two-component system chemotaxis response regulator CheY